MQQQAGSDNCIKGVLVSISIKQHIAKLLPKNVFARNVSLLVGGTVSAQVLTVLASPLLTRLYSPEDFGLLAVYAGILSLFTVIASLRYELAIPLPETNSEAAHIALLSLIIVCLMAMLSAVFVFFANDFLAKLVRTPHLANFLWLLPFGVFAIGAYQVFNYWSLRTKNFSIIAKTRIWQSISNLTVQIVGFKLGALSLLLGKTGSQAVGVLSLAKPALKLPEFKGWQWQQLKAVALRYRHFPLFSTWGGFLNTVSSQLPPLFFAILFSASAAGLYALAHRILAMPISLIGSAVGKVFFANAAEAHRKGEMAALFEETYAKLVSIIMPIMLVLVIDAPRLFLLVFGDRWEKAGELARWMAPWIAVVFITSPLSTLFEILEKQKQGMCFQFFMLIMRVVSIWIGYQYNSITLAIILFSFLSMLCWIGFLIWVTVKVNSKVNNLIAPLFKSVMLSFGCASPLIFAMFWPLKSVGWHMSMALTVTLSGIYYLNIFRKAY